jgi:radical SAM protein with 4Fe4S-binding SPASM domain
MRPKKDKNTSLYPENKDLLTLIRDSGLQAPESMTMMVTSGCNLSCRHCWLNCQSLDRSPPVDAEKVIGAINEFTQLGGTRITLTGGEILTHPEWPGILRFSLDHAQIEGVTLQTNATLITPKHLAELGNLQLDKLTIQVSLDGACARSHDRIRGRGSFADAMVGIGHLVEAGLGPKMQVAFTEMAHNFSELPDLLKSIHKLGIARLISGTLVKGGRAAGSTRMRLPTPDQYRELIRLYHTDADFKALYDQKANISAIEWFKYRTEPAMEGCCSCLKNMFLDVRGALYPCTMLLLEQFASSSIYSRPMNVVIKESLSKWSDISILSRNRQNTIKSCRQCADKQHCGGGCMGRAATVQGELMAPEDRCALRKAVFRWEMPSGVESSKRGC